jgi:HEAT repeat protein
MRASLFVLAALLASPACATPPEPDPAPTRSAPQPLGDHCDRDAVRTLISAPENVPTESDLQAVCDDPRTALVALAEDANGVGLTRLRAVGLLGTLGGPRAVASLARLAAPSEPLASVRRNAVIALGRATKPGDPTRVRVAESARSDPDAHVRAAAAQLTPAK